MGRDLRRARQPNNLNELLCFLKRREGGPCSILEIAACMGTAGVGTLSSACGVPLGLCHLHAFQLQPPSPAQTSVNLDHNVIYRCS